MPIDSTQLKRRNSYRKYNKKSVKKQGMFGLQVLGKNSPFSCTNFTCFLCHFRRTKFVEKMSLSSLGFTPRKTSNVVGYRMTLFQYTILVLAFVLMCQS